MLLFTLYTHLHGSTLTLQCNSSVSHMAATRPNIPSQNPNSHALKPISISQSLLKFPSLESSNKIRRQCINSRCEITRFEFDKPKNWSDPVRIIQPFSPISNSMAAASASSMDSPTKNVKRVCLFYCDDTKALAERVAAESDAIELRSINWRSVYHFHDFCFCFATIWN